MSLVFSVGAAYILYVFMVFCANLASPGPTPEHVINATISWCFWGAFHWKSGISLKSRIYTFSWNSMDFHEIPWNSTDFTKIRDFHWSCHFIRRCEGSRNLSIPIGLLMFSRRGREGSALVEGKHDFLHILGDCGDLWFGKQFSLKMERHCDFKVIYPQIP